MLWKFSCIFIVFLNLTFPINATTINVTDSTKAMGTLGFGEFNPNLGSSKIFNNSVKKATNELAFTFSVLNGEESFHPSLTFTGHGLLTVEVFQAGVGSLGTQGIYMGGGSLTLSLVDPSSPFFTVPQVPGDLFEVVVSYRSITGLFDMDVSFLRNPSTNYCQTLGSSCDSVFPGPAAVPLPAGVGPLVSSIGILGGLAAWRRRRQTV